ncbi:hypothetical protein VAS14_04283 [Photobacterium angustum S14]|uniref:Uncharacterized protein n=1 Tax=Photobacterium angustum (strain S14 / CCUG 15956) TaxID=314292 RepID=Q1ZSS1_PHOAS|nr:hypothetical protein VAS14_04283 [Photobacterium angustum S14]
MSLGIHYGSKHSECGTVLQVKLFTMFMYLTIADIKMPAR